MGYEYIFIIDNNFNEFDNKIKTTRNERNSLI